MLKTELFERIANGKSSHIEFKRDDCRSETFAKEVVAMANFHGGIVLLGVEDDGSISGLTRDRLEEWVMTICRDEIRPGIIPVFEIVRDVRADVNVAVVQVARGLYVHSRWRNNRHDYFVRAGSQSREPTSEELSQLFQQRSSGRFGLRPISGSKIDDLDHRRLKDYFGRVRQQEFPADNDVAEWGNFLTNTGFMADGHVTVSGMLLFGKVPNRFLPQAGIDAVAFLDSEKDYVARERKRIIGPMVPLVNHDGAILETGLVEQAVEFVTRNTSVTVKLEDGARRLEQPSYPQDAVRETVVNAFIHRDYLLASTDIELAVYPDRLEVISPGKLPNGVTPERMRNGVRSTRNELLKEVMRDYGYLEHTGLGVPRKIVRGMREHNGTVPDLVEKGERFTVRLFAN